MARLPILRLSSVLIPSTALALLGLTLAPAASAQDEGGVNFSVSPRMYITSLDAGAYAETATGVLGGLSLTFGPAGGNWDISLNALDGSGDSDFSSLAESPFAGWAQSGEYEFDRADYEILYRYRLEDSPVEVSVLRPDNGQRASLSFPRTWFAEAIRLLMYRAESARSIPYLVHLAYGGDFEILAQFVVDRRYARDVGGDTIGMLLSITCPEDLARIDESRIPELTGGTFAGDERVRQQMAACEFWPTAKLPRRFGDPVTSDVPALLWSGSQDPVTPPKWGDEAAAHLENSLHLVIPAAHMIGGRCVDKLSRRFLKRASVRGLKKQRCLEGIALPEFDVPN